MLAKAKNKNAHLVQLLLSLVLLYGHSSGQVSGQACMYSYICIYTTASYNILYYNYVIIIVR